MGKPDETKLNINNTELADCVNEGPNFRIERARQCIRCNDSLGVSWIYNLVFLDAFADHDVFKRFV